MAKLSSKRGGKKLPRKTQSSSRKEDDSTTAVEESTTVEETTTEVYSIMIINIIASLSSLSSMRLFRNSFADTTFLCSFYLFLYLSGSFSQHFCSTFIFPTVCMSACMPAEVCFSTFGDISFLCGAFILYMR